MEFLKSSLIELITQTSTNLPPDVRAAMGMALEEETPDTQASQALGIIASNIDMANDDQAPICQDTGMPTFIVHTPVGVNQIRIRHAIREAVAETGEARRRDHAGGQPDRRRGNGVRRPCVADRVQDRSGDPDRPAARMAKAAGFPLSGREVVLTAPLSEEQVRALKVGDVVLISGEMYTGRDNVHAYLMKHDPPVDLRGAVLYHCGPVMLKEGEEWKVKAAGPTTSSREEPYQAAGIERYGVRAVIGKGGMGAKTLAALEKCGAVYLNAIGGAAQYYARTVEKVLGVELMEFGIPEAMWHLRVRDFAAIVTMDAHGNSLHL